MSDAHFVLKHGANAPILEATLTSSSGVLDLTGATVTFSLRRVRDNVLVVDAEAVTIVGSPTLGQVSYSWSAPAIALMTPGMYRGEFHIAGLSPANQVWPSEGYIYVEVQASPTAA